MTNREEAILGLKELRDWEGLPYCIEEPMQREGVVVITQEVIDMAIEALEQQPSEDCRNCKKWNKCPCGKEGHENGTSIGYSIGECKDYEPCEDCISRQAVIEGLANIAKAKAKSDAQKSMMGRCMFFVEQLPSVTPERPKGKWIHWTDDYKDYCTCSECGYGEEGEVLLKDKTPYCPYCGSYNGGNDNGDE